MKPARLPNKDTHTTMSMYFMPLNNCINKDKYMKSTKKFVSIRHGYDVQWRDSMPGDLVMVFVYDINHPAFDAGAIHRNYIIVGIINAFVDVE